MKKSLAIVLVFLFNSIFPLFGDDKNAITIIIEEVKEPKGNLMMMLSDDQGNEIKSFVLPVNQTGQLFKTIPGLKPGAYTLKVYHDLNSDGKLNKNILGMPTEPFAFSNNAWSSFGPPSLEKQLFLVVPRQKAVQSIKLKSYL